MNVDNLIATDDVDVVDVVDVPHVPVEQKKKRGGRPLGEKNRPKTTEVLLPKKKGRPFTYMQVEDSTSTPAKLTYHRRGFLVNKIASYKRKYGLTEPTQDKYVGKSNEEVIELLKQMAVVVGKLKDAKFQDQIQSKYYSRSQTADFIYKTPIY